MKENEPESLTALFRRGLREREDAGKKLKAVLLSPKSREDFFFAAFALGSIFETESVRASLEGDERQAEASAKHAAYCFALASADRFPERKTRYVPTPEEAALWEEDAKLLCYHPFAGARIT